MSAKQEKERGKLKRTLISSLFYVPQMNNFVLAFLQLMIAVPWY